MLVPSELFRAAGNVLLSPTRLASSPQLSAGRRALLVGAADPETIAAVTAELRAVAPDLVVESYADRPMGLWGLRRRRDDLVCLLLTGAGRRWEKLLGLLSGAPVLLARGDAGQWYEVHRLAWHPASGRWWARSALAVLLIFVYWLVVEVTLFLDLLQRLRPAPKPRSDPGPVEEPRVTFIVPTYNQRALMDSCLPALLAEAGETNAVIVVDDASTDDTTDYVRRTYPRVQVLRLERNQGFAGAVRAGIAASATPLFALINNDAQVRPGFLQRMLPHFAEPDVFAVCARIELPEGSLVETGRVAAAFSGILEPYHLPPTDRPTPILYAGGASSLFHRARYEALGGLDALYHPFYWEDIELGYRAWRAGWRSVFEPGASVLHQRRATIGPRFGEAYANQTFLKNALLFVLVNVRDRRLLTQHFAFVAARLLLELPAGERLMSGAVRRALLLVLRAWRARGHAWRPGDRTDAEILSLSAPQPAVPAEACG